MEWGELQMFFTIEKISEKSGRAGKKAVFWSAEYRVVYGHAGRAAEPMGTTAARREKVVGGAVWQE